MVGQPRPMRSPPRRSPALRLSSGSPSDGATSPVAPPRRCASPHSLAAADSRSTTSARSLRDAASHTFCVARPEQRRGKSHTVPLDWIYFSPSPGIANSNGAAFGPTLAAAIGSGRREVVERDLVIRAWYGLRPSRELLERETASPRIERWRSAARDRGLDAHWFLLGDRAPGGCERATVYCVLASPRPPYVSTGSATRPNLLAAVEKAFFEAAGRHLSHLQLIADVGLRAFVRRALKRLSGDPRAMMLQHYGSTGPRGRTRLRQLWRDSAGRVAARDVRSAGAASFSSTSLHRFSEPGSSSRSSTPTQRRFQPASRTSASSSVCSASLRVRHRRRFS